MSEYIWSHRAELEKATNQSPGVTASFIQGLFIGAFDLGYLIDTGDVDDDVLYALVFGKKVPLNDKGMKMLRKSIITNALRDAVVPNPVVTPRGSLLMLAYLSGRRLDMIDKDVKYPTAQELLNPFYCFFMLLRSTLSMLVRGQEGDSLELITEWWLKCRFAAAAEVALRADIRKPVRLDEFFPFLSSEFGALPFVVVPTSAQYFIGKNSTGRSLPVISKKPRRKLMTDVVKDFNRATLAVDTLSSAYFESPEGQGFDHFISLSIVEPGEIPKAGCPVFVTVIDNKSAAVVSSPVQATLTATKKLDCSQFDRFLELVDKLKQLGKNTELSRISRALLEGRFSYVYLTTYPCVVPDGPNEKKYLQHPNLVISNAESSQRFYGMCWPLVSSFQQIQSINE